MLQVIISFIVEAFVFKIQARQQRRVCTAHPNSLDCGCKKGSKKTIRISLVEEDIAKLRYEVTYVTESVSRLKLKTLNGVVKRFRRKDFSKIQVCIYL